MFRWTVYMRSAPDIGINTPAVTVGHKVFAFGGHGTKPPTDQINVYVFNTVSLRWMMSLVTRKRKRGECSLEVPTMRTLHTAVVIENTAYIWGGVNRNDEPCNVLYAFDVDTHRWFKPSDSGTVPQETRDHSACVLGKVMYIYGGHILLTGRTNAIYKLDTTAMVWSSIKTQGTLPPASSGHSATIIGNKMFVFGGKGFQNNDYIYHNISVFDTETNCWLSTPSTQIFPKGRDRHSAFAYNGELYIFGGYNGDIFDDVWKFHPQTSCWKEVRPKGKVPCWMTDGCCCMVGDRIILFGGYIGMYSLHILDLSPSLKTLCKLAVIHYGLKQSELPHDIRWELAVITAGQEEL